MDITIASIYSALQEPTIVVALVLGFIFIYIMGYDVKKRKAGDTDATCPAGFGSDSRKQNVKGALLRKRILMRKIRKNKKDRRFTLEELKNYNINI